MTTVAHARKSPVPETTGCPCGWGIHCRCGESQARFYEWNLIGEMRALLESGADLTKRRRAITALRETVAAYDQQRRDTKALRALYATLPRRKDIDLVQRITCDDHRAPQTDEEIAERWRTPLEHVRELRARIVAAYEGRPLPVSKEWRAAARVRRAQEQARWQARRAALRTRRAA